MTSLKEIKDLLSNHKDELIAKYDLKFLAIFGSFVRGQQREDSDIDIIVDFQKPIGIKFIDLAEDLEKLLKRKVDLVSYNGIKPAYLKYIENEIQYV